MAASDQLDLDVDAAARKFGVRAGLVRSVHQRLTWVMMNSL
jgi:hypothetical protein